MITLYGFGNAFGLSDASSFVSKVDCFMRLAGVKFERIDGMAAMRKAPKGKLPYIKDGDEVIADSYFVLKYLIEKYELDIDDHLNMQQRAQAAMYAKALEEGFYWCVLYSRWVDEEGWQQIKRQFFGSMPKPLSWVIPNIVRRDAIKSTKAHGLGRHTPQEILAIADDILANCSQLLGDKPYFFGDKPSSFDATAFGCLSQVIICDLGHEISQRAAQYKNLVDYCQRINETYYPEFAG